jgi:hypothetical protein
MDLAHGDAVRDDRLATFGVGQDMGGIEESGVTEPADGAPVLVSE